MSTETEVELTTNVGDADEHFTCCNIPDDFVGITTAMCGAQVVDFEGVTHVVEEVSCQACMKVLKANPYFCPLGYDCLYEAVEE